MSFRLRFYLPRSLYGRAALILVAPIVLIQLLVSVGFIQRHYEDVTEQMTRGLVYDLRLIRDVYTLNGPEEAGLMARRLGLQLTEARPEPVTDRHDWYDLSGRVIQRVLREGLSGIEGIDQQSLHRQVLARVNTGEARFDIIIERRRVSASNPHQLLVLMVLAGLLLSVIAYVFLRNQLRPIKRLAEASEAFGKGRITPYRPRGAEEVRAAGSAFLQMRARIERQIEQRTLMLSGVSHDLRTPLTRLRLEIAMLDPGPEVDAMLADLSEMERMIDGFLDFARGDGTETSLPCDPAALLSEIVSRARRSGLKVRLLPLPTGSTAPEVMLRRDAVTRAIENLINNGARYGDNVEVSLSWTPRKLLFTVQDDGPGIPPHERERATRPFTRLDSARNANKGASVGLGLAIVSEVALSHGGTLLLGESARLGGLKADLVIAR